MKLDEEAPPPPKDTQVRAQGSKKSHPGKNSQQRRQENFRNKRNAVEFEKLKQGLDEKYGMFEEQGPSTLEAVVKSKAKEVSTVAVPLSITTRGVGFATALTFDRLVTSFEGKPPEVPLSMNRQKCQVSTKCTESTSGPCTTRCTCRTP